MEIPRGLRADLLRGQGKTLESGKVFVTFYAQAYITALSRGILNDYRGNVAMPR